MDLNDCLRLMTYAVGQIRTLLFRQQAVYLPTLCIPTGFWLSGRAAMLDICHPLEASEEALAHGGRTL